MTAKDDGGPAFPFAVPVGDGLGIQHGMSLRDWFAGQALAGLLSKGDYHSASSVQSVTYTAACCYLMADAMLAARSQESSE